MYSMEWLPNVLDLVEKTVASSSRSTASKYYLAWYTKGLIFWIIQTAATTPKNAHNQTPCVAYHEGCFKQYCFNRSRRKKDKKKKHRLTEFTLSINISARWNSQSDRTDTVISSQFPPFSQSARGSVYRFVGQRGGLSFTRLPREPSGRGVLVAWQPRLVFSHTWGPGFELRPDLNQCCTYTWISAVHRRESVPYIDVNQCCT